MIVFWDDTAIQQHKHSFEANASQYSLIFYFLSYFLFVYLWAQFLKPVSFLLLRCVVVFVWGFFFQGVLSVSIKPYWLVGFSSVTDTTIVTSITGLNLRSTHACLCITSKVRLSYNKVKPYSTASILLCKWQISFISQQPTARCSLSCVLSSLSQTQTRKYSYFHILIKIKSLP